MKRADFLAASTASALVARSQDTSLPRSIAGIRIPDSALAKEATEIARNAVSAEIFNHSLRAFLFAELLARAHRTSHDTELVYVASIVHDTGLSARYMSADRCFEVDGADVARSLLERHAINDARAGLVWDAVALHDNGGIARWKEPEVQLVHAGVSADFGNMLEVLKRRDIVAVLNAAPRTHFIPAFLDACTTVAARKPQTTAHSFVADIGYRRVAGFHLSNFVDDTKDDPFAAYIGKGKR